MGDLFLANLDITPREPANEAVIEAAQQFWATMKCQDDIVEAIGEDAVEEMAVQLVGTSVDGVRF